MPGPEVAEEQKFRRHERLHLHEDVQGEHAEQKQGQQFGSARSLFFRGQPAERKVCAGSEHGEVDRRVGGDLVSLGGAHRKVRAAEREPEQRSGQHGKDRRGAASLFAVEQCGGQGDKARGGYPASGASENGCGTVQADELFREICGKTGPYVCRRSYRGEQDVRYPPRKVHTFLLRTFSILYHKNLSVASALRSRVAPKSFCAASAAKIQQKSPPSPYVA